jgi:DNA-binding transcriptional LysR family regulator
MDKLTALRVFRAVVEADSFSGAARKLRLSNAAVSKNVRELEDELGTRLIERTTRRLRLTESGEEYYRRVVAILDELGATEDALRERSTEPRGRLRVAAPMSLGIVQLAPLVGSFLVEHPELRVELEMNDRYVDLVGEGFDVAIRGGALEDSSLVSRKLAAIPRVVCASPSYLRAHGAPRTPADLASHRCLAYSLARTPMSWSLLRNKRAVRVAVRAPLSVNSSLGLVAAAKAGAGIALVPRVAVDEAIARGELVPLLESWSAEAQALYALYPRHHQVSRRVRLFVDYLAKGLSAKSS